MTVYTLFIYLAIAGAVLLMTLGIGHSKWKKHEVTHPIPWYLQYFIASLLLFSGIVKAVDPLGTAYKMKDYFAEFAAQGLPFMDFMQGQALNFSLIMLVLELSLGACLLLGIGGRRTTGLNLLMMLFFTFLTGFNYLTGFTSKEAAVGIFQFSMWEAFSPENIRITDCGCFGDFMKLKPIETFIKDIIFTGMSIYLFVATYKLKELIRPEAKIAGKIKVRTVLAWTFIACSFLFCLRNYYFNIPMVDFRPFAEGTNIPIAKQKCLDVVPEVEMTFIYKDTIKNETKTFDMNNIPTGGPWKYVDSNRKVIKEGCNSQIQYFNVPEVEENEGYVFLVVAGDLDHSSKSAFKQIGELAKAAEATGVQTHALYYQYAGKNVDNFRQEVNAAYPFHTADDKLTKTIIRANPGLVLIKNGVVIKKWHHNHIPTFEEVNASYMK